MKAYNTPKDELHIESDTGETLVSITPEKTTIANLEGGGGGDFIVHATIKLLEGDPTAEITETPAEIKAAYEAGKNIVAHYIRDNEEIPSGVDEYFHVANMAFYYSAGDIITIGFVSEVEIDIRSLRTDLYQYHFGYMNNTAFGNEVEASFANYA